MNIRLFFLLWVYAVHANEPGQWHGGTSPTVPAQPSVAIEAMGLRMDLKRQFDRAAGLSEGQVIGLHYSRVACARHLYSQAGWSVEGDADLKVTRVTDSLYEVEFPSRLYLSRFDPYQTGLDEIETGVSRQLLSLAHWGEGRTLKLFKSVGLSFMDPNKPKQTAYAMDEIRVLGDSYPPSYIVKETISVQKTYVFYMICQ